jgi:general secretion pathway protein G
MRNGSIPGYGRPEKKHGVQKGFTLIEIMVVIAILGILAALIVPKIMSRPDEARRVAARQDIGTIMQSMKLYRLDNGRYPTQEQGLRALVEKPTTDPVPNNWKEGGYLERLPNDPWGHPYQYLNPGVHGDVDVFSYGPEGQSGGANAGTEIGSWQ